MDEYVFLVTDLLTGEVLSTVELSSFYWEEIYNRPGAGLATARLDLATTTPENFKDWSNALWVVKGGEIQWGGIIGRVQRRGQTRVLSVPVIGFFEYFNNRILRSDVGMTYGNLVRSTDIEWRDVDQFHIFQDMIRHAQHESFNDGNINIGVEWDSLSGQLDTMVYGQFTVKYIGPALTTLANRLVGFDFRQVYRFENNEPRCNFKLTHPPHDVISDETLLFQPEHDEIRNVTVLRALELDGASSTYASAGDVSKVVGDIDIRVNLEPDDWTPLTDQTLRSKWLDTGDQRSWKFQILTDGKLRFFWTEDGTLATQTIATSDLVVSFTNGEAGLVRVILDVSEDKATFLESSDGGQTWVSLTTDPYESTYSERY